MVTYDYSKSTNDIICRVNLENKYVGNIKQVKDGFQYFPKNSKIGGDIFKTIKEVKKSLEE